MEVITKKLLNNSFFRAIIKAKKIITIKSCNSCR